ncbi:MAG: hypothetical protein SPI30_06765 [Prevotella sp.]|nr:hypothetical protein [Prevotella sp.]
MRIPMFGTPRTNDRYTCYQRLVRLVPAVGTIAVYKQAGAKHSS